MPSAIIPCLTWVARGKAKEKPDKVTLTREELRELSKVADDLRLHKKKEKKKRQKKKGQQAASQDVDVVEDDDEVIQGERESAEETDEELAEYDFEHYDDEDDDAGDRIEGAGMGTGLMGLSYYASNADDPYITLPNDQLSSEEDEEQSELIKPNDNLLLVGRVDEEMATLASMVVNETDAPYVHHDQMLDSFPLVFEWLDFDVHADGQRGNLIAVGGMLPCIDIWDLDVIDAVQPVARLGQARQKKKKKHRPVGGHSDAVLGLSWNSLARHLLASASADGTVGLWDLRTGTCEQKLIHHSDKVQTVAWHPYEAQSLATGSMDHRCCAVDCRDPSNSTRYWQLSGEVEQVVWNHFEPFQFLAACDDGHVFAVDVRNAGRPLFQLSAHDKGVNSIALSKQVSGLLATVSGDARLKIWDITNARPICVHSTSMEMGELLSARFCPDLPFVLGLGGTRNGVRVLDLRQFSPVRAHFADRQPSLVEWSSDTAMASFADEASMDVDDDEGSSSASGAAAAASVFIAPHVSLPSNSSSKSKKKKKRLRKRK